MSTVTGTDTNYNTSTTTTSSTNNNNASNRRNSKLLLNDLAYDSASSSASTSITSTPSTSPSNQYQDDDLIVGSNTNNFNVSATPSSASQYKQPFQTNYNQTGDLNSLSNMMMLMNYQNSSFNNSIANSSGLGDSISLPCTIDSSAYNQSTRQIDFINSTGSIPVTPTSPNKNNDDSLCSSPSLSPPLLQAKLLKQQQQHTKNTELLAKMAALNVSSTPTVQQIQKMLTGDSTKTNNFLVNGLNQQIVDYDPFNDYMGMDKMMLNNAPGVIGGNITDPASLIKSKMVALQMNQFDPQQQQLIAQAIAAAVANQSNDFNPQQQQQQISNKPAPITNTRSLSENIEILNSKFHSLNQQKANTNNLNSISNNSNNQSSNNDSISNVPNLNSLLATVAGGNTSDSSSTSFIAYNPSNLNNNVNNKRLSFPQSNNQVSPPSPSPPNHLQSTSSPFMGSGSLSKQLNSNHNLFGSVNINLLNQSDRNGQLLSTSLASHQEKLASLSTSNSAFNLSLSNQSGMDPSMNQFNPNNSASSANNSSCYDDDDVFTTSNNVSTNSTNVSSSFSSNTPTPQSMYTPESATLVSLYRNFITNPANNSSNVNEFIAHYNANLAALTLNPDLAQNFLNANKSNSTSTSLPTNTNQLTQQQQQQQQQQVAAVLKQRQNMINNRLSAVLANPNPTNTGSSNIAALTSATSNIAALLNNNNNTSNTNTGQQQFLNTNNGSTSALLNDSSLKRRVNSQSSFNTTTPNNTSLFSGSHNIGPNATHLLQNSSLASSARLNTSTSTSAAASVLGNNSSLAHTLNSLSQHQANLSLTNQANAHLLNGGSLNNSISGVNQSNLLNFPSTQGTNQGILSALSLSSTTNGTGPLLSSSGKPLRSERLPSTLVEEIIKQAKVRRRNGGKKEVCVFCRNNGEKEQIYTSHTLKDASNHVACPILRLYQCPICHASGDQAHTIKYCPYAEKDSTCIKLFKESGRMSAAAALLMNSLGPNTPPSLSPPATPPPTSSTQSMGFLQQQQQFNSNLTHPDMSSPNTSASYAAFSQLGSYGAMSSTLTLTPNQSSKSSFLSSLNSQTTSTGNNSNSINTNCNSILNNNNNNSNSNGTNINNINNINNNNNNNNNNASLLSSNFSNSANLKQIN